MEYVYMLRPALGSTSWLTVCKNLKYSVLFYTKDCDRFGGGAFLGLDLCLVDPEDASFQAVVPLRHGIQSP